MALDIEGLMRMSQAELDDLYRESPVGVVPVGETKGTAIFAPKTLFGRIAAVIIRLFAWHGKVFDPTQEDLRNRVTPLGFKAIRAKVYVGDSWLDDGKTIVLDYSETSFVARKIRDEIREVAPGIYLGKVFWGRKRMLDFALLRRG
jgi:hypothetical protein